MRVTFGPYEPDKPPFLAPGLQVASNVYRSAIGYRPVGQFTPITSSLPSDPKGASTFVATFSTIVVAGTATNLYQMNGSAWTSLASGFSASRWSFTQFGSLGIASNGTDPIQKINLATFAVSPLGGTPPTAQLLAVVKDFLVAGYVGGVSNKLQWSGINNAEFWTIGLNQSDYQVLPTGGAITGILGGEVGIILQRNRISRMTYIGDNLVFRFDEISNSIGCVHANSVIQVGQLAMWLSDAGFVLWDGASVTPIGREVVDRTFLGTYSSGDWPAMSTAVDLKNNLAAWAMADRIFVFNWALGAWSIIDKPTSLVFPGFSNNDALFYAFDSTFALGTFTGRPMEATFGLGDLELTPGRETRINSVRLLSDAIDGVSLTFEAKARQGEALSVNTYDALEDNGEMAVRENGRYHRVTMSILPDRNWTYVEGLDLTIAGGARR